MTKQELIELMVEMLQGALEAHRMDEGTDSTPVQASTELPLIGEDAAVTSMGLVSFISDVESTIQEKYGLEVTLVSEQALSRKKSPFRTIDALADYVLELAGVTEEAMQAPAA